MAEHKVEGGNMLLFIDPLGGTAYSLVVCLTNVGKKDSVAIVDAASACGPDKSPGVLDLSYSFEGQHLQDPSGAISGTDLRILLRSETTIGWLISPDVPVAGDEIESGTGYLSELSSSYAFNSVGTFTGTIQPYGLPTLSIYGGGGGLVVGQAYQGGTIAYIDGTGVHGIIVAWTDYTHTEYWGDHFSYGATNDVLYGGLANTNLIEAGSVGIPAASLVRALTQGGYTDWCLPTGADWSAIFPNCATLGISVGDLFWTCIQPDNTNAYIYNTMFNDLTAIDQYSTGIYIAVRYF